MDKRKKDKKKDVIQSPTSAGTLTSADGGASLTYNIQSAENVYCGKTVNISYKEEKRSSSGKTCDDEYILIIKAELELCPEQKETLHTLEQKVCDKYGALRKKTYSSFKQISGESFKDIIERNSDLFSIDTDGKSLCVSLIKGEKKKKKQKKHKKKSNPQTGEVNTVLPTANPCINALPLDTLTVPQSWPSGDENVNTCSDNTDEENGWKTVTRKKGKPTETIPRQSRKQPLERDSGDKKKLVSPSVSPQEMIVRNLVKKQPDDTLVFRLSNDIYKKDKSRFIRDVISLWNTPKRENAYILMGVETCAKPPHTLKGLPSSADESWYQSIFQKGLLNFNPCFRYWEVICNDARIGVIEMENNPICGFPSIPVSNDLAPSGLRKDQLMARKNGKNVLVLPGDPFSNSVHAWFAQNKAGHVEQSKSPPGRQIQVTKIPKPFAECLKSRKQESSGKSSTVCDDTFAKVASFANPSKAKQLMNALNNFQKVHFVLVSGSMQINCVNVEALAAAPWVAVYDFNFHGTDTGLLGILQEGIEKRRSLSIHTWCDSGKGITERGTQWWSLRGRREIPDSHAPQSPKEWFMAIKDKLGKLSCVLAEFAADYTVLSVLVVWPDSEDEARCMHKFLNKLQEYMSFKVILLFADSSKNHSSSKAADLVRLEFEDSVEEFHVDLKDFCADVEKLFHSSSPQEKFQFQLPSADSTVATLDEKNAAWLAQEMEVLYLQSPSNKALSETDLESEAEAFFRGGNINWTTRYDKKYEHFDIKREKAKSLTDHIQKERIEVARNGVVTILHAPGAGGSTMTRRVMWDLHHQAPCVHVKHRSGSTTDEIAVRLAYLYDECRMPVVALMDGEDESRIKQLARQLQRSNVIILHVKRYPYSMKKVPSSRGNFYLTGFVEKEESQKLLDCYLDRCDGDQKKRNILYDLDREVRNGNDHEKHQMYEFGMSVYLHEFRGVKAYVKGHLQLEEKQQPGLEPWQKCLGFLALVHYFGQSSLPCQFFVRLLGKQTDYKIDLDDLPYQMKVFVVKDNNEGKDQCIRIGHYVIAREILEQILCRRPRNPQGASDKLSGEARRHLKDFSIDFISEAGAKKLKTSITSQTITYILTRTFIFRDNEESSDTDSQGFESQTRRKRQFSQIMTDIDSQPPYQGRLEILQKLCDTFPDNPSFRAHLGRFYTCCRPEEGKEAEKHFKKALQLCSQQKDESEIDDRSKLTLMHIYHMYGVFFQGCVTKLIKSLGDNPKGENRFEDYKEPIVANAVRACENFVHSRDATPQGHEESYIYANEIRVRLKTCEFVSRHYPGGMRDFLTQAANDHRETRDFVIESVLEIESLIMECYDVLQVDDVCLVQKFVNWYQNLFGPCTGQLQSFLMPDQLSSLRLKITATKLKCHRSDMWADTDSSMSERELMELVGNLEDVLREELEENMGGKQKNRLELDVKDWLLVIRHPQMKQVYTTEKVLERVRRWHGICHSPQSTYYLFVLLSMLGFGTSDNQGNKECLTEAQMMLEHLQKLGKVVLKSRYPREWLGRGDAAGIKRLVKNSNISYEDRRIKNAPRAKLAVYKGTICAKFHKPAGFIDLDLGLNSIPVKVFFIPARADLVESRDAGARVQFHLAFTIDKGYEAYEVKLLERYRCSNCPQKVEMTWDQDEVECKKCRAVITKNEHSIEPRSSGEDNSDQ